MKSMIDSGMSDKTPCDSCSDAEAAAALAQGHPKSKPPPPKWNMKSRIGGDARKSAFGGKG